jgi:hypothetical protein
LVACPALRDRPRQHALPSARTNLIAPSRGRCSALRADRGLRQNRRHSDGHRDIITVPTCVSIYSKDRAKEPHAIGKPRNNGSEMRKRNR